MSWRSRALSDRAEKWNKVLANIKKNKEKLVLESNVNQIGIGFKTKENKMLFDNIGILFFVRKKLTKSELEVEGIKPIDEIVKEVMTDVIEVPAGFKPRTEINDDVRYQELIGGISIIHTGHTGSGTLGIILRRKSSQTQSIPAWVKNNAKWWASGDISDNEFILGIQHLIKVGVIRIETPNVSSSESTIIPDWVRRTIGWWGNGQTSDNEFVSAMQFLIKKGIVKIPTTEKIDQEEFFALTNNHVGANEDVAGLFPAAAKKGDEWLQPGFHGMPKPTKPNDVIAKLDTWNKFLPSGPNRFNFYDVALAKLSNQRGVKPYEIKEIGKVNGVDDNNIGDYVLKRGRRTRKTKGIVAGIIPYPETIIIDYHGYQCPFSDQVIIVGEPESTPFSKSGDSGSLIVSEEIDKNGKHKAKALLFSGGTSSSGIDYTFASPIKKIVEDFQLEF